MKLPKTIAAVKRAVVPNIPLIRDMDLTPEEQFDVLFRAGKGIQDHRFNHYVGKSLTAIKRDGLSSMFDWAETPEGYAFWEAICYKNTKEVRRVLRKG